MCYWSRAALGSIATAQDPTDLWKALGAKVPSHGVSQEQPLFPRGCAFWEAPCTGGSATRSSSPARVRVKFVGPQEDSECVLVLQYQLLACHEDDMADCSNEL